MKRSPYSENYKHSSYYASLLFLDKLLSTMSLLVFLSSDFLPCRNQTRMSKMKMAQNHLYRSCHVLLDLVDCQDLSHLYRSYNLILSFEMYLILRSFQYVHYYLRDFLCQRFLLHLFYLVRLIRQLLISVESFLLDQVAYKSRFC